MVVGIGVFILYELIKAAAAMAIVCGLIALCGFVLYSIISNSKRQRHETLNDTSKENKTTCDPCQDEQPDDNSAQNYWREVIDPKYNPGHEPKFKTESKSENTTSNETTSPYFDIPEIYPQYPDPKDLSGDMGEEILCSTVSNNGNFLNCHWWTDKRIKSSGESGKSEVDLILISHNYIYLFESKFWSGTLKINPNYLDKKHRWMFVRPVRDNLGNPINETNTDYFEDLTKELDIKLEKLKTKLKDENIEIPSHRFKTMVVFTNKNIAIDIEIRKSNLVATIQDLEKELEWDRTNLSQEEKYIIALIRYIIKIENNEFSNNFYTNATSKNNFLEQKSLAANIELVRFIDKLPSWDRIKFYGGKKIKGDLRKILKTFKTEPPLYVLRRGSKILVKAPRDASEIRNKLENGDDIDILFEIDKKIVERSHINPLCSRIKFHKVGEEKPDLISIYQIEEIIFDGLYDPAEELGLVDY